jgi:ABC-type nickel/cobalt efflux system permease component RcnA
MDDILLESEPHLRTREMKRLALVIAAALVATFGFVSMATAAEGGKRHKTAVERTEKGGKHTTIQHKKSNPHHRACGKHHGGSKGKHHRHGN